MDDCLSAFEFEGRVRELAEADAIIFTTHAQVRMALRGFSEADVIRGVIKGKVTEGPFRNVRGNYQASIERFMCGEEIKIVAAIEDESGLIIITVIN